MMGKRNAFLLWLGLAVQLMVVSHCLEDDNPEARARMEEKAMSSVSLDELEKMVESMKPTAAPRTIILDGEFKTQEQLIKHLEDKKLLWTDEELLEKTLPHEETESEPRYYDHTQDSDTEESERDLETQASNNIRFFEDLVSQTMKRMPQSRQDDLMTVLDAASSEYVPSYKPRFNYEAYVKDPIEVKLNGKPYWRGPSPSHRHDSVPDGDGCRTVVKKLRDDEDSKEEDNGRVKSVIISKECEYPDGQGPDAKIAHTTTEYQPPSPFQPSAPDTSYKTASSDSSYYDSQDSPKPSSWSSRNDKPSPKDPLKPGYIDDMLDAHFKSFSRTRDPLSLLRHHHERLSSKLSKFDEKQATVEPTYKTHSYEYKYPETDSNKKVVSEANVKDSRDNYRGAAHPREYAPVPYAHSETGGSHHDKSQSEEEDSTQEKPKMMKKSFAYYRKDNPKDDPDNHEYAEEYAQGNYRSFSTDYDSDRDGPEKKVKS